MKTANLSRLQVSNLDHVPDLTHIKPEDWLISIRDIDHRPIHVVLPVDKVFHFAFLDTTVELDGCISEHHAEALAYIISMAKKKKVNLWVNCHAGVSRSGALVELLAQLGWTIEESMRSRNRIPNVLVYDKVRKHFPNDDIKPLPNIASFLPDSPIIL